MSMHRCNLERLRTSSPSPAPFCLRFREVYQDSVPMTFPVSNTQSHLLQISCFKVAKSKQVSHRHVEHLSFMEGFARILRCATQEPSVWPSVPPRTARIWRRSPVRGSMTRCWGSTSRTATDVGEVWVKSPCRIWISDDV